MGAGASSSTLSEDDVTHAFRQRVLKGKLLGALQAARSERGETNISEAVMNATDLRASLEDLGDSVSSKDLYPLVQMADPDGDGVVTLERFREVVALRKQQHEREREQALLMEAYLAIGGNLDRDAKVPSSVLAAVVSDFVGANASKCAMDAVAKHKFKSVQSVLDAGGALDSDDEEELKDTKMLAFDEMEAFGVSLRVTGADAAGAAGDDPEQTIGEAKSQGG